MVTKYQGREIIKMLNGESLGELIDYGQAQEIYVDDWDEPVIRHGVLSVAGYRIINGQRVIVIRIVQPAQTVPDALRRVEKALRKASNKAPTHGFYISDMSKVMS